MYQTEQGELRIITLYVAKIHVYVQMNFS